LDLFDWNGTVLYDVLKSVEKAGLG